MILIGILLPFLGTALGAAAVFLFRGGMACSLKQGFFGFAAGVMTAAAVWSLLIPALDTGGVFPAGAGLTIGYLLFLLGDVLLENKKRMGKTAKDRGRILALAVTLHNIPEGMAVGVALAAAMGGSGSMAAALTLSLGIALQNLPEGAVISMPLASLGTKRIRAFFQGVVSGVVEPIGAVSAILLTTLILPALPFVLSFAAGAMLYVVAVELIPALSEGGEGWAGYASFLFGFTLMMLMDVILG
ncbi:MAG: ZIP family metal transporter [Clostridia bacterium]|nr:ZIP family metal transporter [Clostridia bacterium]